MFPLEATSAEGGSSTLHCLPCGKSEFELVCAMCLCTSTCARCACQCYRQLALMANYRSKLSPQCVCVLSYCGHVDDAVAVLSVLSSLGRVTFDTRKEAYT